MGSGAGKLQGHPSVWRRHHHISSRKATRAHRAVPRLNAGLVLQEFHPTAVLLSWPASGCWTVSLPTSAWPSMTTLCGRSDGLALELLVDAESSGLNFEQLFHRKCGFTSWINISVGNRMHHLLPKAGEYSFENASPFSTQPVKMRQESVGRRCIVHSRGQWGEAVLSVQSVSET